MENQISIGLMDQELKTSISKSKFFEGISSFLGSEIDNFIKVIQRTRDKSKSTKFNYSPYLSCFAMFVEFLKARKIDFLSFRNMNYNDRNLIYSSFIASVEKEGKLGLGSIRNQVQSKVQAVLKRLDLRVEQPKKSIKVGITENYKNKVILTKNIVKMIYDEFGTKMYRLLFMFHVNTGLRFSDLQKDLKINENEDGRWYMQNVPTDKEGIYIDILPLSSEFKQMTLQVIGKKPETVMELFGGLNGNKKVYINAYNSRLSEIIGNLAEKGIIPKNSTISSHDLRRFYYNQWLQLGDSQLAQYMTGHSLMGTGSNYSRYQIMQKYSQIESLFMITTSIVDKTSEEVKKLQEKLAEKDKLNEKMQEIIAQNTKDIDYLKKHLELLENITPK